MGIFTQHMTRLCAEIVGARQEREALVAALAQEGRTRETAVREMCGAFRQRRKELARRARQQRLAFVAALKRAVDDQRKALRTDLAGARAAWEGRGA